MEGGERGRKWLSEYQSKNKMTWPNVMAGAEWYGPPMDVYGVGFLPFNLLLDRQGRIVEMEVRGEDLQGVIARALALDPS